MDPRSKLMISLVQDHSRDQAASDRLLEDFFARTEGKPPELLTTDEHAAYKNSILKVYGVAEAADRADEPTQVNTPPGLVYATVNKTRKRGTVVDVKTAIVFGTPLELAQALDGSPCSSSINTSFVERNNGTARHFNARKQRKTYSFSKQFEEHEAMSWFMMTHYNFCWRPRTLRVPRGDGSFAQRSPAVAAGITDHVWTVPELLTRQILTDA